MFDHAVGITIIHGLRTERSARDLNPITLDAALTPIDRSSDPFSMAYAGGPRVFDRVMGARRMIADIVAASVMEMFARGDLMDGYTGQQQELMRNTTAPAPGQEGGSGE